MHAIAICLSVLQLHAVEVEVEGKSDGQMPAARLQALTEALNEAVRTGAGVVLQGDNAKERKNYDLTVLSLKPVFISRSIRLFIPD